MTQRLQVYEGDGILVTFDPNICIHSGVCIRGLPAVFDVSEKRWIRPEQGTPDAVAATVGQCPSGALQVVRAGRGRPRADTGASPEAAPARVPIGVRPNGPILVRGPITVTRENGEVVERDSCSLCRCGATGTAPFCDGSHNRIGFKSPS